MTRPNTIDAARGKWKGILATLGLEQRHLTGKAGPCPMCEGTDRFTFDNRDGVGSYICRGCGSGTGMQFVQKWKGLDFAGAAALVDQVLGRGDVRAEPVRPPMDDARRRQVLTDLWRSAKPITPTDPAGLYLASRGLVLPDGAPFRFAASCPVPGGTNTFCHAMLARVDGPDGKPVSLHRTFLTPAGREADMDPPRALMPGEIPEGAAIRLGKAGDRLGIAEGIETALAAAARFGLPVWSAINAMIMKKWTAPEGVKEVVVFADNDPKYGGQAAGYALAHRLACKGLAVTVQLPDAAGTDWADRVAA